MLRVWFVSFVCFATVTAADDGSTSDSSSKKTQCHPMLRVPISKLSPDDKYSDSDVSENGTVCICNFRPCFLKCCPEGYSFPHLFSKQCVPEDSRAFTLSAYKGGPYPSDYSLLTGMPCPLGLLDDDYESLLANGSLISSLGLYNPGNFCLEYINETSEHLPFACLDDDDSNEQQGLVAALYPVGMLISIPFYIATLVVYAIIPELRNTLHGMSFMSHIAIVIVGYSFLTVVQLDSEYGRKLQEPTCSSIAYIVQFAFLATFFWMNVMCFDIWWTFSSLKKPGGSVRERDLKKFLLYSIYAWGFPLLILIAALIAEYSPLLDINSDFRPNMGVNKCFFKTAASTWLFLYGPIAILVVTNLVMFAFTAKKIFLHTRETQVLKSEDSKRHDSKDRERFNLYLKLFIVMGVNWVAELISWADASNKVFYITDITNTLQGFIIFVIFVCKRRVLRLLEASLCPKRAARRNARNSSSRSRNTTTSVINGTARNGAAQTPETMQLRAVNDSDSNM